MKFFQLFLSIFTIIPYFLNAIIYLQEPCDFHPKLEVVGCFLEYSDKILLLHRQEHTSHGNTWAIPGGKLEKSETPIEAAIRETMEETGFDISKQPITYLGRVYITYPRALIYHMVKCTPTELPETVKISFKEHKGFTWVTPQDALKMNLMLDEDPCIRLVYPDLQLE